MKNPQSDLEKELALALRKCHKFISMFTSGNSVQVDVKYLASTRGQDIAIEATKLRDEYILPALEFLDKGK